MNVVVVINVFNALMHRIAMIMDDGFHTHLIVSRHLQIVAGMERFEYVVVYWILITETEAILKKKVPKIATGSF